jgi:bacillithiol biosynthesis deacetylase BshB2
MNKIEKERHVLVIFPHPDDEALGVAGTLAMYAKNNVPITYACLTLGEMGRNLGNPPFATRETLPKIRKQELEKAAEIIGIQDLRMMGLRDKTVEFEDDEKMVKLVTDLIEELNPSLIITFYPGYSVHPDHEATGRAVVRAVRRIPEEKRPKLYCSAFSKDCERNLGAPDIVYDIREVQDIKIAALKAHISQTAWMLKGLEERSTENNPISERLTTEHLWSYQWDNDEVD